jgi:hypothetical protein
VLGVSHDTLARAARSPPCICTTLGNRRGNEEKGNNHRRVKVGLDPDLVSAAESDPRQTQHCGWATSPPPFYGKGGGVFEVTNDLIN